MTHEDSATSRPPPKSLEGCEVTDSDSVTVTVTVTVTDSDSDSDSVVLSPWGPGRG
jgi:hypothetical protein